jgi:hypothetical protein
MDSPKSVTCAVNARTNFENWTDTIAVSKVPRMNFEHWELIAAPNPTTGKITVTLPVTTGQPTTLSVTNIWGHVVSKQIIIETGEFYQNQIDLSNLIDGIYIIKAQTNRSIKIKRIVLTR